MFSSKNILNNSINFIQNTYQISHQIAEANTLQGLWPSLDLLKSLSDLWKSAHLLDFAPIDSSARSSLWAPQFDWGDPYLLGHEWWDWQKNDIL
jgi:hypothetical protein